MSATAQMMFTIGTAATAGGANNWPAGEPPAFAVDGNPNTKYLNFAKLNTGYVFTPTTTGTVVTGIKFTTANDSPERDPASYILYGSNSLVASTNPGDVLNVSTGFTQISTGSLTLSETRLTAGGDVTFTNATAYNTYLLVFPTVRNEAGANSMQIGEAVLQTAGGAVGAAGTVGGGLLTTVPEAGSTALLGLAGLGLVSRRRRA
ncbi:MAG: PEP-CTERM sorting domain-containing protein [Verrucomicrobiota bacterium]